MLDEFFDPDLFSANNGGKKSTMSEQLSNIQDEKLTAVAEANWEAYVRARDSGHLTWVKDADKHDDFYQGAQWASSDHIRIAPAQ